MNREEKLKALEGAITQIEKAYGKGSVMKLGDSGSNMNIETVPTGSLSLDIALGDGRYSQPRIRRHQSARWSPGTGRRSTPTPTSGMSG